MQDVGCPVRQEPVKTQRKDLLSTSSTCLHLILASGTPACLLLPFLLDSSLLLSFPWSSPLPPPPTQKQLGLWWLRVGRGGGEGGRAVYRNWSSSIHQLCLEQETKHNKYLGSSPAVLFLNLAIRTPNLSGLLVSQDPAPTPPHPPPTSHQAALERALPLGPETQG